MQGDEQNEGNESQQEDEVDRLDDNEYDKVRSGAVLSSIKHWCRLFCPLHHNHANDSTIYSQVIGSFGVVLC